MGNIITVPFGWLLGQLYNLFDNYGVAMIVFGVLVQLIMLPIKAKSKKSMMKMSRLQPRIQEIQKKYENDKQKQNEAIQKLQQEEGASMGMGGCLWSFVPLLILFPLFTVIREPITYILGQSAEMATKIVETLKEAAPDVFAGNVAYAQVTAAQLIPQYADVLRAAIPELEEAVFEGINFNFLGIDLGGIPSWKFWAWEAFTWANVGAALIPLISAGSQVLQMWVSQQTNNSVVTDEKGIQDKETAEKSQANQTSKMMMWMMPFMSLWLSWSFPVGIGIYWAVNSVLSFIQMIVLDKLYTPEKVIAQVLVDETNVRRSKELVVKQSVR